MAHSQHDSQTLCQTHGKMFFRPSIREMTNSCPLRTVGYICLLFMAIGIMCRPAAAQNSSVQGEVTDPQGAVSPGAKVAVTNTATGVLISVSTNDSGIYIVPNLLAGQYRIEITKSGFGPVVEPDIQLNVNQTMELNFALNLGQTVQDVTVKATGEVLNTATATVGQTISNRQVIDLPLNGRNYLQLGLLTPGTTPAYGSRFSGTGAFSALGQDTFQFSVILDGAVNDSLESGGELGYQAQAVTPPIDAVDEFEVVTNNNAAEYGRRMGATVIASIKSGTDSFHGDAWEFFRNDSLDAANFFSVGKPKPILKYNQFGGTLGGPIIKDRTFFFVSYQGTRNHSGTTSISTVPTMQERNGDFAGYKQIFDPATTVANPKGSGYVRTAFSQNMIPAVRFDPVAVKAINLYPLPNYGSGIINNYYYSGHAYDDWDEVDARLDHNFSASERLYARYSRRWERGLTPGCLPLPADGGCSQTLAISANSSVVGLTSTISPTLVNDLTLAFTTFPANLDIPWSQNLDPQLGITGIPPNGHATDHGMTELNITNYATLGPQGLPNDSFMDDEQFSDKLMYSHGRHLMKFGIGYLRFGENRAATRASRGNMTFAGYFTQNPQSRGASGDAIADLLLGDASAGTLGNINGESLINPNYSAFAQDTWQVTKRLTVNLGVRWDLFEPPSYHYYWNLSRFDPFYGTPNYNTFEYPTGNSDTGANWNYHNFAPRVGIAYQLTPRTVLRSGFGIFYGMTDAENGDAERFYNEAPPFTEISFTTDELFSPALVLSKGFPPGLLPATTIQPNTQVFSSYATMPDQYSEEWFFDVQRELSPKTVLTLSYMGNEAHFLNFWQNADQPLVPGPGAVQSRRPFPYYSSIRLATPLGNANYNGLIVKLEKHYSAGLTVLSSYTYSHALSNVSEVLNSAEGQGVEDNYNMGINRGNSTFDLRHVFVTSAIYDLPFGYAQRFLNRKGIVNGILGGWRVGGIVTIESGPPFTPTISTDLLNLGTTNRPNAIGNGNLPRGQRSIADWFNLAAFTIPAPYTFGTASRDSLYGPGLVNIDLNLAKSYQFTESTRLDFRAEAFDFTNTPHFGIPAANVNLAGAGQITSAAAPREIQLALKFYF